MFSPLSNGANGLCIHFMPISRVPGSFSAPGFVGLLQLLLKYCGQKIGLFGTGLFGTGVARGYVCSL